MFTIPMILEIIQMFLVWTLFVMPLVSSYGTTMIYTHVLNRGGKGVISPADNL